MRIDIFLVQILLASLVATTSFASTGEGGGHWKDSGEEYLLADDFYPFVSGEEFKIQDFPEEVLGYIRKIEYLVGKLGLAHKSFWENEVWKAGLVYIYVTEDEIETIPCKQYIPSELRDHEDQLIQFGCTDGKITYLVYERIVNKKVSVDALARAIVHERLRALDNDFSLRTIAGFTKGVGVLARNFKRQNSETPDFTPLDRDEITSLRRLVTSAKRMGFISEYSFSFAGANQEGNQNRAFLKFSPHGGLITAWGDLENWGKCDLSVHAEASVIGVGSFVPLCGSRLRLKNAKILNSKVDIYPGSQSKSEYLRRIADIPLQWIEDSVISGSRLTPLNDQLTVLDSEVIDSDMNIPRLERSKLFDSKLSHWIEVSDSEIYNSSVIDYRTSAVESNAQLRFVRVSDNSQLILEGGLLVGTVEKPVTISDSWVSMEGPLDMQPGSGFEGSYFETKWSSTLVTVFEGVRIRARIVFKFVELFNAREIQFPQDISLTFRDPAEACRISPRKWGKLVVTPGLLRKKCERYIRPHG